MENKDETLVTLEKVLKTLTGLDFHVELTMYGMKVTSSTDINNVTVFEKNKGLKIPISKLREGLTEKMKEGTLYADMKKSYEAQIKILSDKLDEAEKYQHFFEKLELKTGFKLPDENK
jgi:hypothetical protein